jgi:DHA2 family multidrug resistance protein-like MFS transporter
MTDPDGLPAPRRYWALSTILLGLVLVVVDESVVSIALPTLTREFGTDPSRAIWAVNAYQLAAVVCLIPFARLADIVGHRRLYCLGLLLFALASLACILARSLEGLVAARTVQGIGASGAMSVNLALTRFVFPRRMLGRAIGYNGLTVAVSASLGPMIGGAILAVASWQWLFALNIPLGLLVVVLGWRTLPDAPRSPGGFDVLSAVLCGAMMGLLIIGIGSIGRFEQGPLIAATEIAAAVVLGWILWRRQAHKETPLVPVDLLRIPLFRLSIVGSALFFAAQSLALISLPFYYQMGLGQTEAATGLLMAPWPVAVAITAPIAGRLADRYHPGILGVAGAVLLATGLWLLAILPADPEAWDIVWRAVLAGIGVGLFQMPNNRAIISSAPMTRSGAAAGLQSSARLLGQASGVAIAGLIFTSASEHAAVAALLTASAFAIAASVASALRLRS